LCVFVFARIGNSTARSTSLKATLRRQRQCAECGSNMLINGTMCARIRRNVWDCTVKSIARPVTARRRDARSGGPRATTTTTNFCYNYLTAQPSRNSVALGSRFAPTDRRHVAAAKGGASTTFPIFVPSSSKLSCRGLLLSNQRSLSHYPRPDRSWCDTRCTRCCVCRLRWRTDRHEAVPNRTSWLWLRASSARYTRGAFTASSNARCLIVVDWIGLD